MANIEQSVVRVSIPAHVANDLHLMQAATKNILTKLGCGGCHSGRDILFQVENSEHILIGPKGELIGH